MMYSEPDNTASMMGYSSKIWAVLLPIAKMIDTIKLCVIEASASA